MRAVILHHVHFNRVLIYFVVFTLQGVYTFENSHKIFQEAKVGSRVLRITTFYISKTAVG